MRVYIGIPMYGGAGGEFVSSLLKTRVILDRLGYEVEVDINHGCSILTKARNDIVRRFLASEFDVLMFIDSDMVWSPVDAVRLLKKECEFSAIPYRKKTERKDYTCSINGDRENGMIGADSAGTGFMLLSRSCLLKMVEAYPETAYEDGGQVHALFDFELYKGQYWGEDCTFCRRWKAIGGKIWLLPAEIGHVGTKNYKGTLE